MIRLEIVFRRLQVMLTGTLLLIVLIVVAMVLPYLFGGRLRADLTFSKDFKGPSKELVLYMERVDELTRAVTGNVWADITAQPSATGEDVESTVMSYQLSVELLRGGAKQVHDDPERYSGLITWRNEATGHGMGRPTVEEALMETWISYDCDLEYRSMLDELIELCRSQGRMEAAEQWSRHKVEFEELGRMLAEMSRESIQRLRPV